MLYKMENVFHLNNYRISNSKYLEYQQLKSIVQEKLNPSQRNLEKATWVMKSLYPQMVMKKV